MVFKVRCLTGMLPHPVATVGAVTGSAAPLTLGFLTVSRGENTNSLRGLSREVGRPDPDRHLRKSRDRGTFLQVMR
jgi:hypothetical protein